METYRYHLSLYEFVVVVVVVALARIVCVVVELMSCGCDAWCVTEFDNYKQVCSVFYLLLMNLLNSK